ncbi:MAG: hypothetical protein Q9168_008197 [Polycauliona sp. 1 TL-2023]
MAQKHLSRLVAALTDFHKAQCFFMLAINIATLVAIQRGGFEPRSLQQIYDTYVFLQVLAINGILPITFTLANLYLVGMLSWFLVLLSSVTVVLSIATLASVGQFNPSETDMRSLAKLAASGGPPECDGMQPGIYCLQVMGHSSNLDSSYGDQSVPVYAWKILGFCLVNMALLIGRQLQIQNTSVVRSTRRYAEVRLYGTAHLERSWTEILESDVAPAGRYHRVTTRGQLLSIERSTIWQFCASAAGQKQLELKSSIRAAVQIAIYVIFFTFYVRFYNMYLNDLAWFAINEVNGNTWNFGQVFAITVWVPPIVEYIHLEMRGMHRGFDHRLLPPFQITRTPTPQHTTEVPPIHILPPAKDLDEPHDLESGPTYTKDASPVRPASANSPIPSSSDDDDNDDDIGKATIVQGYSALDDDNDFVPARQDHHDESDFHDYHSPTEEPDAIIPLQSYHAGRVYREGDGDVDTERLLPPLDFESEGGRGFEDLRF